MQGTCTRFGTYTTQLLSNSVACQSQLGKYADANSMVAAATWANSPTYNSQCGKCIKITNLDWGGPQVIVRVIDQGGGIGGPGIDINDGPAYTMTKLDEVGHINCKWEFVDSSLCTFI